jgi:hypothetical protein
MPDGLGKPPSGIPAVSKYKPALSLQTWNARMNLSSTVWSNAVTTPLVQRLSLTAVFAGLPVSCGAGPQSVNGSQIAIPDLQTITESIAGAAHYPANTIEIMSSPVRFRISIRDAQLATSDEGTRNATADGTTAKDWHIEDVVEFRKGPNQRFSVHIT